MKALLANYVQTINKIVQDTEKNGDTMNPYFETIRTKIDEQSLASITAEELATIKGEFERGTAEYQANLATLSKLKPPAKAMGIHKKFERTYGEYVQACEKMVASLQPAEQRVDIDAFNQSEADQDEITNRMAFCIQRLTSILSK